MKLGTWQGWRGWKQDEDAIPWVPCPTIKCLQKRKRPIGWYDAIWFFLCIGSYAFVSFMGWYYFHQTCDYGNNSKLGVCKSKHKGLIYKLISSIGGGVFLVILGFTRSRISRFKCVDNPAVSVNLLGLWANLVELVIVAVVGGLLHVHVQMFSWLFISFAIFDMCVMKLIVPTYDFKGPTVLAQVAVAASLFSDVRSLPFTPLIIFSCIVVFHLKFALDFNWRDKLSAAWVEFLIAHGLIVN